jgi:hypothetical protein
MSALTSSFVGVAPKVAAMKPKKAQRSAVTAKAVDVDSLAPPTTRVAPRVPEGAYFSGSLVDATARSRLAKHARPARATRVSRRVAIARSANRRLCRTAERTFPD